MTHLIRRSRSGAGILRHRTTEAIHPAASGRFVGFDELLISEISDAWAT